MSQKGDKKGENSVSVAVRIRPRNPKEIEANMPVSFAPTEDFRDVQELNEDGEAVKHWSYDHVFGPMHDNKYIFETMGVKLVDAALDGYNSVLFMYGQTSSGKTFTLFGGGQTPGVVQHSMEYLHSRIMASEDTEYVVRLTYAELYNEELKDLLAPNPSPEGLKIIDDAQLGPVIQNITEVNFTTAAEVKMLLDEGEKRRHFGVTNMNAHSSRSHVLVRLSIESRKVSSKPSNPLRSNWGKDKPNLVSTLNLVDLAGSERANKSGTSGLALKEGSAINKSLLTLGTVIASLSEGKKDHINYRDSKLTRLLSTALGGNAKTSMITCISPASGNISESTTTLRFASRAKRIVNQVSRNEVLSVKALAQKLAVANSELDMLRAQLDLSRQMGFFTEGDGAQGESLLSKALALSRSMRNFKFITNNHGRLAAALKHAKQPLLAKKVRADFKAAQTGKRDLGEIVEEHTEYVLQYLKNDRKLTARVQWLAEENESDRLYGEGSATAEGELDEDDDDVPNIDSEELQEQVENAYFYGEEVRGVAVLHLSLLQRDLHTAILNERAAHEQIQQLQTTLIEHEETISRHVSNELTLQNKIHKTQEELEEEHKINQEKTRKINACEAQITEMETKLSQKEHDIIARDAEIARFRSAAEQFERDVQTANAQKKVLEEEFSRQRNDMRQQMEKMRGNMHTMLQHGGDQVKVLEGQLEGLQKELETVKDYLEEESRGKERLEVEMSHLRSNIAVLQDEQRLHMSEMDMLRKENAELSQKVKDSRWKMIKVSTSLTVSEEHNAKMRRQCDEELSAKEEQIAALQAEMRVKQDQLEARCNAAIVQADKVQLELAAALESIEFKNSTIARLEQTLSADTARLEKKLHAQTKHNEELAVDLTNAHTFMQAQTAKHLDEAKALRLKVAELQGIVDAVNKHIEEQVAEIDASRAENESGESSPAPGTPYSPYNRHDSFLSDAGDSPMVRSVSFVRSALRGSPGYGLSPVHGQNAPASPELRIDGATDVDEPGVETKREEAFSPAGRQPPVLTPLKSALKGSAQRAPTADNTAAPEKAYWEPPDEYSAQFQRVHTGLQLLSLVMTHAMNEERVLRGFVVDHHAQLLAQSGVDRETIEYLEDTKEHLEEKNSLQQDSLEYARESERRTLERLAQADSEYRELNTRYQQIVRGEQAALGSAAKFEQLYLDLELQVQKLRAERKHYMDSGLDSNVRCMELEARVEEQAEAYSVLQSTLSLKEQELAVLKTERDELLKRFLRNGYLRSSDAAAGSASGSSDAPPSPMLARSSSATGVMSGAPTASSTLRFADTAASGVGHPTPLVRGVSGMSAAGTAPFSPQPSGPVRSPGLSGRTPSFLSSPLPTTSSLAVETTTPAPVVPPRSYYENSYGRYSTLTPQPDRKPSEVFERMFGVYPRPTPS